jgi:hypothetical protein
LGLATNPGIHIFPEAPLIQGDYVGAIAHYDEGLEYRRASKALWTNKALAELKVFRWHDAIASCSPIKCGIVSPHQRQFGMDFLSKKNMMMNIMGTLGVSSFETTGMEF